MNIKKELVDYVFKTYVQEIDKHPETHEQCDIWSWGDTKDMLVDIIEKVDEFKYCMPDNINTKEEHEEYLKAIGHEKYVKDLQHHKDTTIGLYAFDKELDKVFEWMPNVNGCKTSVETYLVEQIEYLKSIVFKI